MLAKTATPVSHILARACVLKCLEHSPPNMAIASKIIFMVCAPLGWLISAACPTPRNSALGFHTDALLFRLLVAFLAGRDLLLCAKHLFVAAMMASAPTGGPAQHTAFR